MPRRVAPMTRQYGTGSLSQRQNANGDWSWFGQWWETPTKKRSRKLGPVRPPGGKDGMTRKAAEAKLREEMAKPVEADTPIDGVTFAMAGKTYRAHLKRQGRKKATIVAVESCLRVWVIPFFGATPIDQLTFRDIEKLIATMEDKGLSPKSIANYCGTISALFTYGMDERRGWTKTNPVQAAELPAVERHDDIRFLEPEQIDALIRAVPDESNGRPNPYAELDRVLYRVASQTGMRQGELVALRWGAVDWPARKIRVRRNYVLGEDIEPKSQRSKRGVPMGDQVATALAAFQPFDATDDDLVFADPVSGSYMSNAAILRRFRTALKRAGLPTSHRFHDLRHTFATRMAAHGTPIRTLQEFLGHRDIQTTMRYADYAPSIHEAQMVDAAFGLLHTQSEGDERAILPDELGGTTNEPT